MLCWNFPRSAVHADTHTCTHTEWISLRYAQEFPQHLVLWYLALGTLVAACCSRFSSPWMLDSCASCLSASQKSEKKEPTRLLWNRVGNSLLLRSCWIIFEKKKVLSANFFFPYFFSRTLLSSAVGVNLSPQRGCLEIHPLGSSRSVPLHPPVASISTTTTKPVLKSIFPNCLATRIIIVVRIACSKTTPNPYRNLLYYTIYHMYICYGYGLLRGNELLIL